MRKPVWIDERDTLVPHNRLLALHGGAGGLRDGGLLQSALARPQQQHAYAEGADVIDGNGLYGGYRAQPPVP
jgi:death on curing protein